MAPNSILRNCLDLISNVECILESVEFENGQMESESITYFFLGNIKTLLLNVAAVRVTRRRKKKKRRDAWALHAVGWVSLEDV